MPAEQSEDEFVESSGLPPEEEVQRLRKSQRSILAKSHERKARIEELEAGNTALTSKLAAAEAKVQDALVGVPLRAFAESISDVPKLWLSEFQKSYKVESIDGKLSVLNLDGTPVFAGTEPVPFTPNGIWTLVTGGAANYGKDESTATFAAITRWCGPTGSGATRGNQGSSMNPPVSTKKAPTKAVEPQFGLR
jgi:hypothetical protein